MMNRNIRLRSKLDQEYKNEFINRLDKHPGFDRVVAMIGSGERAQVLATVSSEAWVIVRDIVCNTLQGRDSLQEVLTNIQKVLDNDHG